MSYAYIKTHDHFFVLLHIYFYTTALPEELLQNWTLSVLVKIQLLFSQNCPILIFVFSAGHLYISFCGRGSMYA